MTLLSKMMLGSALALSFAAPVSAQSIAHESQTMEERNVYLFQDGKMIRMRAGDPTHAMIMKEFKPLKNGTMIYASGGKLYMSETKKMADGKMLHTEIFGRDVCVSCN
jgi:hypothetical protein